MSPIQFFAVNACLTLILAFVILLVLMVLIGLWTGVRVGMFAKQWKRADADLKALRVGPDGQPIPPRGQGICQRCTVVRDDVLFLPDGRRLCKGCYDEAQLAGPPGSAGASEGASPRTE